MRLFLLLTIILAASCSQSNKEQSVEQKSAESPPAATVPPGGIGGTYVNKKYVEKLLDTKSPKASQSVVPLTMLIIPGEVDKPVTFIWGFHEGTSGTLRKRNDQFGVQMGTTEDFDFTLSFDGRGVKTADDEFVKIEKSEDSRDHDVVEQLLFAGKYTLDGNEVEFTPTGRVIGIDSITHYSVLLDYYDAGLDVDQVRLGSSFEMSIPYGFTMTDNSLIIHQLMCIEMEDEYCVQVENGKVLMRLSKKRPNG